MGGCPPPNRRQLSAMGRRAGNGDREDGAGPLPRCAPVGDDDRACNEEVGTTRVGRLYESLEDLVPINRLFGFQRGVMVASRSQLGLPA